MFTYLDFDGWTYWTMGERELTQYESKLFPAAWTSAHAPGRPSWSPCVGQARSGGD